MEIPNNLLLLISAIGAFTLVGLIVSEIFLMSRARKSQGENNFRKSIEYQ